MHEATVWRVDARGALVGEGAESAQAQLRGALFQEATWATRPVAVGDRVRLEGAGRDLTIAEVLPRRNQLVRRAKAGEPRAQVIAANLDQVAAVGSVGKPSFSSTFVDRVLATAAACEIPGLVVLNKIDEGRRGAIESILATYRSAGLDALAVSARTGEGLEALHARLRGRVTVVTGLSGVGKSTIANALLGKEQRAVGRLSWKWEQGRHTTSAAEWVALPGGGALVDTPGIRTFAPWGIRPGQLRHCFPDLEPLLDACRFADCAHHGEAGCALNAALARGALAPSRLASYLEMAAELEAPPEQWSEGSRPEADRDADDATARG